MQDRNEAVKRTYPQTQRRRGAAHHGGPLRRIHDRARDPAGIVIAHVEGIVGPEHDPPCPDPLDQVAQIRIVEEHGIEGTPSFIVNGKKVENQAYDSFKKVIEAELGS